MGAKILVADDSITIQKVVELTFSKEDFQIFTVNNGEDAIKKAKEVHPDLLLVDVIMPQKNGYEVCEALRADPSFREVPILLLAGTFETFDENEGRRVGANDFVTKPFESQILVAKVKQLLEESKSRPPAVAAKAKEEALPFVEAEPDFHLPPEVMMEEPTIPPPFKEDAARELKKMGFWEPPKSAAPPAASKEPAPIFLEEVTEPKETKAKEEIIYELEVEGVTLPSKLGLPEEKLWEMADLGKTEIIELPATPPPAAATGAPSELPPLDLSGLTAIQPSVEQMAQELGLDMASKAPPAEEFKMEELIPQAPPPVSPPESIKIAPSKGGELPPEIVSFETLGDAAAMEMETEEAAISPPPSEKVEPISLKVKPSTPPFVPIVEEKPPVKAAVPLEVSSAAAAAATPIKGEVMEELVQRVVKEMAEKILEKVAWEVIPDMAEILIIKEIERIKAKAQEESRS